MPLSPHQDISSNSLKHLLDGKLILLVTATPLETSELHKKINPLPGYQKILKVSEDKLTYYFGVFGNYQIAHIQTGMGSISRDSSIMTVSTALKKIKSKVVIMVGIAFGTNDSKQKIGDVLVSESVVPYNVKRVGGKNNIQRGIEAPASKILLNRFRNIQTSWTYALTKKRNASLIFTRLLSGEELVDNLKYRNQLIKKNPDSKGGEMEGIGVYSACDGIADWILVKGICDFADGNKGRNKEKKQTIAVNSAIDACLAIFASEFAFTELKINSNKHEVVAISPKEKFSDVLFEIYSSEKEPYYIKREDDANFNRFISQFGLWIHGPSGCGKSNLITRNLSHLDIEFIQVNLASCIGLNSEDFFKEILFELAAKYEGVLSQVQPQNFAECSKQLLNLLIKHFKNKELIIYIEEIPIGGEKDYQDFSDKIFSLIIGKSFVQGLEKVKFVLSSINDPTRHIQIFQQKIHYHLNFMSLKYWNEESVIKLIELIESELGLTLMKEFKESLVTAAKGSPRFIKKFFRNAFALEKFDATGLQTALYETQRDLIN